MVTRILRLAEPPRPADAADALALAICHVWRGGAQPASRRRRWRGREVGDRVRRAAGSPRWPLDGAVVEVGGVGLASVHARHAGRRCGSARAPTCHVAGGAGGLADAVRLRRRRRAGACSSCCRPPAASGRGWPRRCSPCTPRRLRQAVATEDLATLTQVPGIGRKGAQRIVLELKDRSVRRRGGSPALTGRRRCRPAGATSCTGLVGLGWSAREADEAVTRGAGGRPRPSPPVASPTSPTLLKVALTLAEPHVSGERTGGSGSSSVDRRGRRRGRAPGRGGAAAAHPGRVHRAAPGARAARPGPRGRPRPRPGARPRPAVRPAGPGQDHPGDDHRRRAGAPLRITSGPAIQHAGDLAAILSA